MSQMLLVETRKGFLFRGKNLLGSGAYGKVFRAEPIEGGDDIALKQIKKTSKSPEEDLKEVELMEQLEHPNIVKFLDAYEDPVALYIAMELAPNGNLEALLLRRGKVNETEAKFWIKGIASALVYLADMKVVHGDLKPQNILLGENLKPIVADFGFSLELGNQSVARARGGTTLFMAPEVLRDGKCGVSADVWSLGAIWFRCLQGGTPGRPHGQPLRQQQEILRKLLETSIQLPPMVPKERILLAKMLHVEPKHRVTAAAALNDTCFKDESTISALPMECLRTPLVVDNTDMSAKLLLATYALKNIENLGADRHDAWVLLNACLDNNCTFVGNLQLRTVNRTRKGTKTIVFAAKLRFTAPLPLSFTCGSQKTLLIDKFDPNLTSSRSTISKTKTASPPVESEQAATSHRHRIASGSSRHDERAEPANEGDDSTCVDCRKATTDLLTCTTCSKDKLCVACAFSGHGFNGHVVEEWAVALERRKIREDAQKMRAEMEQETAAKKALFEKVLAADEESKKKVEKLAETEKKQMPLVLLREGRKRMLAAANTELQKSKALRKEVEKHINGNI